MTPKFPKTRLGEILGIFPLWKMYGEYYVFSKCCSYLKILFQYLIKLIVVLQMVYDEYFILENIYEEQLDN